MPTQAYLSSSDTLDDGSHRGCNLDFLAHMSAEFQDIVASHLSTLQQSLLKEHDVFVRKRDEFFSREIEGSRIRSPKIDCFAQAIHPISGGFQKDATEIAGPANTDSEGINSTTCCIDVVDLGLIFPDLAGTEARNSEATESAKDSVNDKALLHDRSSSEQESVILTSTLRRSGTRKSRKSRASKLIPSDTLTSPGFVRALHSYYESSKSEDGETSLGKMGQDPNGAMVELINDLPSHVLHAIETSLQEPDAKLGLKHFFINSSRALLIQLFMDLVLVANIISLGFQADIDWSGWLYVDLAFALFFSVEVALAFIKYGCRDFFFGASWRWHCLDLFLTILSVLEVVLEVTERFFAAAGQDTAEDLLPLRTARLFRLARILRLLRLDAFRDLLLMVNGAIGGVRTLFWSIFLISVPVYAFALFFTETVGQKARESQDFDVAEHFNSVPRSMFTGFRCLVLGDCTSMNGTPIFPHLTHKYGWGYGAIYLLTSISMSFGLFNVIVAIYVENTVAVAKENELLQRHRRLRDQAHFAENMLLMVRYLWSQLHGGLEMHFRLQDALKLKMDRAFFESVQDDPRFHLYLDNLDVPREDHLDIFDCCDCDGSGSLTFEELVSGIKRLRGDPRRSDLVFVMLRVREMMGEVQMLRSDMNVVRRITTGTKKSGSNLH